MSISQVDLCVKLKYFQCSAQAVKVGRYYLSDNYHLAFRIFKAVLFLGVVATIITLSIICKLSLMDLVVCCLAFLPTGWGLILVRFKIYAFSYVYLSHLKARQWNMVPMLITFIFSGCASCQAED